MVEKVRTNFILIAAWQSQFPNCGPEVSLPCSAAKTWQFRFATHCRPSEVRLRWRKASPICGSTLLQKNVGYVTTKSAGLDNPSFLAVPVSTNSWNSAFNFCG